MKNIRFFNDKVITWRENRNPFYNSYWISRFLNKFIYGGNKLIAEKAVYKAFEHIQYKNNVFANTILLNGLEILKPIVGIAKFFKLRGKRRKRKTLFIPVPIPEQKQRNIALSWFVKLIFLTKKTRRRHKYINIAHLTTKKRGLSKSKKKIFDDRFQIVTKTQFRLTTLIINHFCNIYSTKFLQLIRRQVSSYVSITNNRIYLHYRWT